MPADTPDRPKTVSLPVIDAKKAPKMGSTRTGKWRAALLLVVNLLIVAHIIQWLIMGSTISPVEPSESMLTLETGVINAGAILFALAILSTMVFGRFFCGWLCHVVALQDACAWLMNKAGIRPKPFRSRLLVFVPLAMGTYMFIWPTFKRLALQPAFRAAEIDWPAWLKPVQPINMWQTEMVVEDFWATFGNPWVAIPFLLICGFVTVYFLGAKGFCTYACPYGGLFAPAEKIAPVRIRVTDACMHCGHCTSVCTSNVRVSDEVRNFGMVVDPGCMKCMDCVSACPSDALYLGLGAPAIGARVRDKENHQKTKAKENRRYDMTWPGEIAAAGVFIACFFAFRGMLDQIALLLAGGLAAIATYVILNGWWLIARPHVRIYRLILKQKGKVRPAGGLFALVVLGLVAVVVWGANARYNRWRVDIAYASAVIPAGATARTEFALSPAYRSKAEQALAWLDEADSFEQGGLGWSLNADYRTWRAYYLALLGRTGEAADQLELVIEQGNPGPSLIAQLVRLRQAQGLADDEIEAIYVRTLELHPDLHPIRLDLAIRRASETENPEAGRPLFDEVFEQYKGDVGFRFSNLSYYNRTGRQDIAGQGIEAVAELAEKNDKSAAGWLADLSGMAMRTGNAELALDLVDRATKAKNAHPGVWFAAAEVAGTFGDGPLALERIETALDMKAVQRSTNGLNRAAGLLMRLNETDRAIELYRQASEIATQPFEQAQIGQTMANLGRSMQDPELTNQGMAAIEAAAQESQQPILFHDLAVTLYRAQRVSDAAVAMETAATLGAHSPVLAMRAADMWRFANDPDKAATWDAEQTRRQVVLPEPASP
ncbi:MAG: 4Fe-4S binding protein [Phycisphaerales bacterium]